MSRGDWARSYRRNQGKRTRAQRRALRDLWPAYGLTWTWNERLDLDDAFGKGDWEETVLDIGFGHGESLLSYADRNPSSRVLGVEVYRPGLGAALLDIHARQLANVRVLRGDIFEYLTYHVAPRSFDRVHLFFPEPWPDSPQRRIVRPLLIDLLTEAIRPNGLILMATDVAEYRDHIVSVFESVGPGWALQAVDRDERGTSRTRYEQIAADEGREVYDFVASQVAPQ